MIDSPQRCRCSCFTFGQAEALQLQILQEPEDLVMRAKVGEWSQQHVGMLRSTNDRQGA